VIDPDECIDCQLCVPECPIDAIYADEDLPKDQRNFLQLNAELAKTWPAITEIKPPLDDADEWNGVPEKLQYPARE